ARSSQVPDYDVVRLTAGIVDPGLTSHTDVVRTRGEELQCGGSHAGVVVPGRVVKQGAVADRRVEARRALEQEGTLVADPRVAGPSHVELVPSKYAEEEVADPAPQDRAAGEEVPDDVAQDRRRHIRDDGDVSPLRIL